LEVRARVHRGESLRHRDIDIHEIKSLKDRRLGISMVKVPGRIWVIQQLGTHGKDSDDREESQWKSEKPNRCIGVRHFASPEDEALWTSEVAKSREAIRAIHLERMHGSDQRPSGKGTDRRATSENQESKYRGF
jgi:hypothetical protein